MHIFHIGDSVVCFEPISNQNEWNLIVILPDAIADCSQIMGIASQEHAEAQLALYHKHREVAQATPRHT